MITDEIGICCVNVQGIQNSEKRRDIFDRLRNQDFKIICLTDTHFDKSKEKIYSAEWGYVSYFSSFTSQSRGVAILFKNNFEFKVKNVHRDHQGNLLILDLEIENHRLSLAVLYGPNQDNPVFYQNLQKTLTRFGNQKILIVGDWNMLLDPEVDGKNYKHINNPRARLQVLKMITELNLYDIYRCENGESRRFTWKRKLKSGDIQLGRLDFFLLSESLMNFSKNEKILTAYRSDHCLISLSLCFSVSQKSKTFWKFNNSLLNNINFVSEVKHLINEIKIQYGASPYNPLTIDKIEHGDLQLKINPQLFFDILLLEIRSKTIAFSSALKRMENDQIASLEAEIKKLEQENSSIHFDLIKQKENELKSLREKKLKGVLIRSRARWLEHGEKPSNFFCNLENRHFVSKKMTGLIDKYENELNDFKDIENEVYNFYKQLYTSKEFQIEDVELKNILNDDTPKLSDDQSLLLEGELTLDEALHCLKNMKNNKSPGSSGFNVEFFKFFWKDLGTFLVKAINYGFHKKELSITQREGVVTCIPKGNKCKKYLKNWRPISLLNVSYKIASGCIANRIKTVLPTLIDFDQSGFMSQRFTGDNLRLMYDILFFSKQQNKRGLLLLIDFEKAFDTIAWSFIKKTLAFFNFKKDIIRWIDTFYNNIKSTVIVNNKPTSWFQIERGCRQGDPISPYIFLLCSEVLGHMIRQKKEIKGYTLFEKEIKISQFADDTSLFLDGSQESFQYCVETILEYTKFSGLATNNEKTKVVWFGCQHPPNITYLQNLNFEWNPEKFSVLGVDFTINLKNITDNNINKKMNEITQELSQWSKRDLTPFGKTTVIKTLILSKIVHLLLALPSPSDKILNKLNKLFYSFLWREKPDPIKRSISKQKLINGGIGMIDVEVFDKSLKLTWIKRYFETKSKWKTFIESAFPEMSNIKNFGNVYIENLINILINPFWKHVLKYYLEFFTKKEIKTVDDFKNTSFLYNSNIRIGHKVIKDKLLINNQIFFIQQLKQNDDYLLFNEFKTLYKCNLNFLQYNSLICAIKNYENKIKPTPIKCKLKLQPALEVIMTTKSGTAPIYKVLLDSADSLKGYIKWSSKTEINKSDWIESFEKLKNTTQDTKLRWLQYRILHNILTTNKSVANFRRDQTPLCTFCNTKNETISHLFWECKEIQYFWENLEKIINKRCMHSFNFRFTKNLILFGFCSEITTDPICDLIILIAKYFIYRCKVQKVNLSIQCFTRELYNRYCIEKIVYKNTVVFRNKWGPYLNIFKSVL